MALDRGQVARDFADLVNLTSEELRRWLRTADSRRVGWKGTDGRNRESVGHASGRRIASILDKPRSELTDEDYAHMRKVVGFIRRMPRRSRRTRCPHAGATR